MATKNQGNGGANTKKRKHYLPHNKPVKKKGGYPLRPGIEGFFITCDGGRERQAAHEAINVIDLFYEELVCGKGTGINIGDMSQKPSNKKIVFSDSSSSDDEEEDDNKGEEKVRLPEETSVKDVQTDDNEEKEKVNLTEETASEKDAKSIGGTDEKADSVGQSDSSKTDVVNANSELKENANGDQNGGKSHENEKEEAEEPPVKKQCVETVEVANAFVPSKVEDKSIDKQIEDELKELGDKTKRRFFSLDSGCNGVVIIQMRRNEGDPSPKDIVQHMMTSAAATRKHMSRFILRVLPIEVACYSSEEEISRAIKPLVSLYFPTETEDHSKFAVMYDSRANSGIDRMKIINAVAKSVPGPHKVNLSTPDKTIVVEIVKTVCLIGVVEKFKELSKYNLRQLTSTN